MNFYEKIYMDLLESENKELKHKIIGLELKINNSLKIISDFNNSGIR